LQQLLADDFWGCGSTADWVDAIVCVAGLINGSTLPYFLGCDKSTGKLTGPIGNFIGKGVQVAALASGSSVEKFTDFDLDQWLGDTGFIDYDRMLKTLDNSHFAKGEDNLAFDLSLQGCLKANNKFKTNKNTYYLSVVTSQTKPLKLPLIAGKQIPELSRMNPLLTFLAAQQVAMVTFDKQKLPIPGWGTGDLSVDKWQENDGAVSSISQRYPFTAGNHPLACK